MPALPPRPSGKRSPGLGSTRRVAGLWLLLGAPGACVSQDLVTGERCVEAPCADPDAPLKPPLDAGPGGDPVVDATLVDAAPMDAAPHDAGAGPCTPGRYEGRYELPRYRFGAASLCGIVPLFVADVAGRWTFSVDGDFDGGMLVLSSQASCVETIIDAVTGQDDDAGAMPMARDGGVEPAPPLFAMSGTIDCASGHLSASLRGYYRSAALCGGASNPDHPVHGSLSADFDARTGSFVNGVLDLQEPGALPGLNWLGGAGIWEAARLEVVPDGGAPCDLFDPDLFDLLSP